MMDETPRVVLAVYAHPDDADVACGGSLARWTKAGGAVHLVVCTDGGKGTTDPAMVPGRLAAARLGEVQASSELTGLSSVVNLGFPDGELIDSDEFRCMLVQRVRSVRPDVVCGHDPTAVFFGRNYVNHRDHRIAGAALLDAVAPAAALPHYFPDAGSAAPGLDRAPVGHARSRRVGRRERHRRDEGGGSGVPPDAVRRPRGVGR